MEINLNLNFFNIRQIKHSINPNQKVSSILNEIIEKDNSLKQYKISFILCNGDQVDKNKSFNENKIKDGNNLMIMSDSDLDESMSMEDSPFKFKVEKCITKKSHVNLLNSDLNAFIDRTFALFKSIKNQYLLIYSYSDNFKDYSLICYDILKQKKIFTFKNAHKERVFTCIHYFSKIYKVDLLITAAFDKLIKIWKIDDNFELIYKKKPDYIFVKNTYLLSECMLFYSKDIFLIASAYEINSKGYNILYYNLLDKKDFGEIDNSKDNTNYLESYYNNDFPYIIAANYGNIKIFNFLKKSLIKEFSDKETKINYLSVAIQEYENKICLIATSSDGLLRIWNYKEPKNLINRIQTYSHTWLIGLELINNQYMLAACADGSLKEFDLYKNYVSCSLNRVHDKDPLFVVKYIEINGEKYVFTHSFKGVIEMWKENID